MFILIPIITPRHAHKLPTACCRHPCCDLPGGVGIDLAWPIYDGISIFIALMLLFMRYAKESLRRKWVRPPVSDTMVDDETAVTSSADIREMWFVSHGLHALLGGILCFTTAFRLTYFYVLVCPLASTAPRWSACLSHGSTLPAAAAIPCIIATMVYASFFVENLVLSIVIITGAYVGTIAGSFTNEPGSFTPTLDVTPESIIIVLVCFVLGWIGCILISIYVNARQRGQFILVATVEAKTAERIDAATETARAIADLSTARESAIRADSERRAAEAASAFVAHSLRNPLHQIINLLDSIMSSQESPSPPPDVLVADTHRRKVHTLPPDVVKDLEAMAAAAHCMDIVVADMLAYQRILSGEIDLIPSSVNVRDLLREIVTFYSKQVGRVSSVESI